MSTNIENGLTAASGADSFITSDMIITGDVIWVDSVSGSAGGAGTSEDPVDDLAQAVANATANNGDVIVIKSGHTETLTSAITISKAGLKIFGLGAGSAAPNFICNASGIDCIDITAVGVELNNLYFPAGTTAANTSRINIGAAGAKIKSCTFLCGAYDADTITIADAGDDTVLDSLSMTVTADGPNSGIVVEAAGVLRLRISNCTFNADSIGWDNAAIYSAAAHTEFIYDTVTLTNGADIIHTAAAKGYSTGLVAGDECQVTI